MFWMRMGKHATVSVSQWQSYVKVVIQEGCSVAKLLGWTELFKNCRNTEC